MQKAKDGGLDVIQTYVFWNGHEPSPGNVLCILSFLLLLLKFCKNFPVLLVLELMSSFVLN